MSGSTVSWTPTHTQSRTANQFTVTATTAKGGSATQTWSVTPSGVVVITAILTYWTPSGAINHPRVFLADLPYPAALIPQSDGSLTRLQGAANPDGRLSIPHVPAGYYCLQLAATSNFWTSTSNFDAGQDIVGNPHVTTTQNTTTFNVSLSNANLARAPY